MITLQRRRRRARRSSIAENQSAVTTVAAADPDGSAVTYAIAGGADAARFAIDAATGALAFVAAPRISRRRPMPAATMSTT